MCKNCSVVKPHLVCPKTNQRATPMTITAKTRTLLRKLVVGADEDSIWRLYSFYEDHGEEAPTQKEIKAGTGLNPKTIKAGTECLEELSLVRVKKAQKNRRSVLVRNVPSLDVDAAISLLLEIYDRRYERKRMNRDDQTANDDPTRFTVEDICEDDDWKKTQPILKKHFGVDRTKPQMLVRKKYFVKLCQLLADQSLDFEDYCRWYQVNKFPYKGFNYGLFLLPSMIEEYRVSKNIQADDYLKTSTNLESDEDFEQEVAESEAWLTEVNKEDEDAE